MSYRRITCEPSGAVHIRWTATAIVRAQAGGVHTSN